MSLGMSRDAAKRVKVKQVTELHTVKNLFSQLFYPTHFAIPQAQVNWPLLSAH